MVLVLNRMSGIEPRHISHEMSLLATVSGGGGGGGIRCRDSFPHALFGGAGRLHFRFGSRFCPSPTPGTQLGLCPLACLLSGPLRAGGGRTAGADQEVLPFGAFLDQFCHPSWDSAAACPHVRWILRVAVLRREFTATTRTRSRLSARGAPAF